MSNFRLKDLIMQAMIASIYVVLVYVFQFASFGMIQFRIAEVLMILVLFDKKSVIGLTLGCFVANWVGGAIIVDIFIGPIATFIAGYLMVLTKKRIMIALLWPGVINGIIVGLILTYGYLFAPLYLTIPSVFIGEIAVMYLFGLPLYYAIKYNENFLEFFKS